jgi:hypothetical protein
MAHRWNWGVVALALAVACGGEVATGGAPDGGFVTSPPPGPDGGVVTVPPPPVDSGITTHSPPDSGVVTSPDGSVITFPPPDSGVIILPVDAGLPDAIVVCTPVTCQSISISCGPIADGCGGVLECGECAAPDTCGGGGQPNVCGSSGSLDASGSWTGTWKSTSSNIAASGIATMQLVQQGTSLSGEVSLEGTPCLSAAQLAATISGGAFTGTLTDGTTVATIAGQVTGSSMTGTLANTGTSCLNATGAFSLTR